MINKAKTLISRAAAAVACVCLLCVQAFAASANPSMGDTQGRYIGVIIAVMAVALIVMIIIAAVSAKKKK